MHDEDFRIGCCEAFPPAANIKLKVASVSGKCLPAWEGLTILIFSKYNKYEI
jgi:hypothetical protein